MALPSLFDHRYSLDNANLLLRRQLLWMLLLRVILYSLLLVLSFLFTSFGVDMIVIPTSVLLNYTVFIYLITISSASYLMLFTDNLRRFGFIQTLIDTVFVSILVLFSGSSASIFTTVYFFPVVAGGLLLPKKGGLIAAAAASIQYGLILYTEIYLVHPYTELFFNPASPIDLMVGLNQYAVHGLTLFLAAVISAIFGARLQKTEKALTESIQNFDRLAILYKQIFDNISTGILTTDGDGRITSANNAIEDITGYGSDRLVNRQIERFFPDINLKEPDKRMAFDFTSANKKPFRIGYSHMLIKRAENDPHFSQPAHKIITLRDITEIERLEQQVRQSEKLAAIGTMSASIAHDFRNPLAAISGSAQLLLEEYTPGKETDRIHHDLVNIVLRESNRLIATVADFLKFSRPENLNCEWFTLTNCLNEVLEVLQAGATVPESVKITFNIPAKLAIWGDQAQLFTVFSHLIHNAVPFCPEGDERIHIVARENQQQDNRQRLLIFIADNGTGIDITPTDKIFEPFYTNRADGTGLGLSIVHQIIDKHKGTIGAANNGLDNDSGSKGALFIISLPLPQE
jgi:two-component system sensor histidine kinase PilS (NtrC family)